MRSGFTGYSTPDKTSLAAFRGIVHSLLVQGVSYLVGQRDYDVEQSGKNKQQVEYFKKN